MTHGFHDRLEGMSGNEKTAEEYSEVLFKVYGNGTLQQRGRLASRRLGGTGDKGMKHPLCFIVACKLVEENGIIVEDENKLYCFVRKQ